MFFFLVLAWPNCVFGVHFQHSDASNIELIVIDGLSLVSCAIEFCKRADQDGCNVRGGCVGMTLQLAVRIHCLTRSTARI